MLSLMATLKIRVRQELDVSGIHPCYVSVLAPPSIQPLFHLVPPVADGSIAASLPSPGHVEGVGVPPPSGLPEGSSVIAPNASPDVSCIRMDPRSFFIGGAACHWCRRPVCQGQARPSLSSLFVAPSRGVSDCPHQGCMSGWGKLDQGAHGLGTSSAEVSLGPGKRGEPLPFIIPGSSGDVLPRFRKSSGDFCSMGR